MGWEIAQRADKFRIWSTISDAWLTDWITREEAVQLYYDDALMIFKKQIIEKYLAFPHHWTEQGPGWRTLIINEEGSERYLAWMRELSEKSEEEYEAFIDETFEGIMLTLAKKYP